MKNIKKSQYQKWLNNNYPSHDSISFIAKESWNAVCNKILSKINYKQKQFGREFGWQHEDIEYLIEDIKEMIEK